jgi:fibronectin-binding autotransporter adhesin
MSTLQVDRIIPYQSASVSIDSLSAPNLATTGSNTFTGNQNIQGTITASIAQGFALVGGVGNISTLVATSSFGGALPSGVVSGSAQISGLGFATTGSNTFTGNQTITGSVSVSGSAKQTFNVPTLGNQTDIVVLKGATINGVPFNQQTIGVQNYDFGIDAYKNAFVIEAWDSSGYNFGGEALVNGETAQLFVVASGSGAQGTRLGNIAVIDNGNQKVKAVLTGQIIEIGGAGTNTTAAIAESITIGKSTLPVISIASLKNEISGSTIISGSGGLQVTGSVDISGAITASIPTGFFLVGGAGNRTISASTGSFATVFSNTFNGNQTITNGQIAITGSGFTNTSTQFTSVISGSVGTHTIAAGSQTISGSSHRNLQGPRAITITKPGFNYPVFEYVYTSASSSILYNFTENLTQTASYTLGVFDNGFTQDVELQIETTTTEGIKFYDIRSDTGVYTTFLKIAPNGGSNPPLQFKRGMEVTGSVSIAPTHQVRFATGSNQQAGTAVLDGGNPGTVTVSNSLVTANSIIMVSKQTLAHSNGYVAVSAKGSGTFTITSNHNGDTDTVGWFVINNS